MPTIKMKTQLEKEQQSCLCVCVSSRVRLRGCGRKRLFPLMVVVSNSTDTKRSKGALSDCRACRFLCLESRRELLSILLGSSHGSIDNTFVLGSTLSNEVLASSTTTSLLVDCLDPITGLEAGSNHRLGDLCVVANATFLHTKEQESSLGKLSLQHAQCLADCLRVGTNIKHLNDNRTSSTLNQFLCASFGVGSTLLAKSLCDIGVLLAQCFQLATKSLLANSRHGCSPNFLLERSNFLHLQVVMDSLLKLISNSKCLLCLLASHSHDTTNALGNSLFRENGKSTDISAVLHMRATAELERVVDGSITCWISKHTLNLSANRNNAHRVWVSFTKHGAKTVDIASLLEWGKLVVHWEASSDHILHVHLNISHLLRSQGLLGSKVEAKTVRLYK
eukprot:m.55711 g.55711  ORF g.55711 m.55711 type:complete len:392 (-) comp11511_c0_seq1:2283-3458(-)